MKYNLPNKKGYYGEFGGKFVPETLIPALEELEMGFEKAWQDDVFKKQFNNLLQTYVGRPTKLTFANRLTNYYGKAKIYLKREDL
ncbi:MAG TPA: hypothetical protein VK106_00785, partial [Balneolaceae bacterium]|nr:hypothetical protein [Balneolaceae bacterium]